MVDISSTQIGSYDTINELRRKVGDWVKEHFREPVRNIETNTLIEFNKDSRRHPSPAWPPAAWPMWSKCASWPPWAYPKPKPKPTTTGS